MKLLLVRNNIALEAPKPAIATLKEKIAMGVLELNASLARGALNSYQLTRDRVNQQVDEYIRARTLRSVS